MSLYYFFVGNLKTNTDRSPIILVYNYDVLWCLRCREYVRRLYFATIFYSLTLRLMRAHTLAIICVSKVISCNSKVTLLLEVLTASVKVWFALNVFPTYCVAHPTCSPSRSIICKFDVFSVYTFVLC